MKPWGCVAQAVHVLPLRDMTTAVYTNMAMFRPATPRSASLCVLSPRVAAGTCVCAPEQHVAQIQVLVYHAEEPKWHRHTSLVGVRAHEGSRTQTRRGTGRAETEIDTRLPRRPA